MNESVTLKLWSDRDQPVLERNNTPEMTLFLGGPESDEQIANRQTKFLRLLAEGEARMFTISVDSEPEAVGSIGYWNTEWHDTDVYETGWAVATAYQGRGYAAAALRLCLQDAADQRGRPLMTAYPRVDNGPSNALCRSAGFTLWGEEDDEYPAGNPIRSNVWTFDLRALRPD